MIKQEQNVVYQVPKHVVYSYFGVMILNVLSCLFEIHILNTLAASISVSILIIHIFQKQFQNRFLLLISNSFVIATIISSYFREYEGISPVFTIVADLFFCSSLMIIFLKFRYQPENRKVESDWRQIVIIFGIGILFIFMVFEKVNLDYQILIMFRMFIFAMTIFYGLFRSYLHKYVTYGILSSIFTTFVSGLDIFVKPELGLFELQTILYLFGIYLLNVGIMKSEKSKISNFKSL